MAVKWGRWLDHLHLWVAFGACLSTGIYEPAELLVMATPLLAGGIVEGLRWDFGRQHRWLEAGALVFFLGDLARGGGVFYVAIHTLFVLAGVRLILPREPSHHPQLLLMSFLLFLTTAIGANDFYFLMWTLAWSTAATLALVQQSWEPSAALRRGALSSPPYAKVPVWVGGALLLGCGFFVIIPRLSLGLRPGAFLGAAQGLGRAGMSDRLDLAGAGPIEPNPEVALRILPPPGTDPLAQPEWVRGLLLLRGITLESIQGSRWDPSDLTPASPLTSSGPGPDATAEFLFSPSPRGILALPAGVTRLAPAELVLPRGPGASIRWRFQRERTVPLTVTWNPALPDRREPYLSPRRLELLTRMEPAHDAARRASFRLAPGILPTPQLGQVLESSLRRFTYTLDNPSGKAANPLEDFLERTQAGHCEYYASAMALMLRARGVPARVVNGYRLGTWIPEGGYFRVTQNEAHSWVEYWHEGRWWTSDPTPQGMAAAVSGAKELGIMGRWLDALSYRWERYVVRFSDQDQQAGLSWLQERIQGWQWRWKAPPAAVQWGLGVLVLAWLLWRTRGRWQVPADSPGRIRALHPLLRVTLAWAPPRPGDTARSWLLRLSTLRPERRGALATLADAVDGLAYGAGNPAASALAKAEAAAWRGWKPISPS
ncbi:MAG: transglutaminase domain-containing protein [Holophagaceae bacterium]|uniref:Transglutaminase domain-containing protein n=1 Tax=Candidatus Geothrix odensensis TaxID=2954440 RepID=A0A936K7A7_9BACT|nr:transglutaminase domain-containing protein [Candidatus Geothrix odensensis]